MLEGWIFFRILITRQCRRAADTCWLTCVSQETTRPSCHTALPHKSFPRTDSIKFVSHQIWALTHALIEFNLDH